MGRTNRCGHGSRPAPSRLSQPGGGVWPSNSGRLHRADCGRHRNRPLAHRLQRRDFELAIETTGNAIDDPDQVFYETFSCRSERNYNHYCNPEIERLFDVQSSELDVAKRRQLAREIDARLLADAARLPLTWKRAGNLLAAPRPWVRAPDQLFLQRLPLEDVWKERR